MALDITQTPPALASILGGRPMAMNTPMTLGSYQPANYFGGDILGAIRSAGGSGPNVVSVQPQVPTNIGGSIIASGQTPPIIGNTRPMSVASPAMTAAPAKADPLAAAREYDAMIAKRNEAARAAVLGRLRQQQTDGERSYAPANPQAAHEALMAALGNKMPDVGGRLPQTLQRLPGGGIIADYGEGVRVVSGPRGTAASVPGKERIPYGAKTMEEAEKVLGRIPANLRTPAENAKMKEGKLETSNYLSPLREPKNVNLSKDLDFNERALAAALKDPQAQGDHPRARAYRAMLRTQYDPDVSAKDKDAAMRAYYNHFPTAGTMHAQQKNEAMKNAVWAFDVALSDEDQKLVAEAEKSRDEFLKKKAFFDDGVPLGPDYYISQWEKQNPKLAEALKTTGTDFRDALSESTEMLRQSTAPLNVEGAKWHYGIDPNDIWLAEQLKNYKNRKS